MPLRENIAQAREDLEQARQEADARFHEWAVLLSKEAAESALRILAAESGIDPPRADKLEPLAYALLDIHPEGEALVEDAQRIDQLHDPAEVDLKTASLAEREGGKTDYVDASDAEEAIGRAQAIVDACERQLSSA